MPTTFNIDPRSAEARGRDREAARPQAQGRHPGRSVRPAGRPRRDRRDRRRRKTCSCSTTPRRRSARPTRAAARHASAHATATSFFPAKPLGCYGDGGAVFTDDDELADDPARACACTAQGTDKYDNVRIGLTGRLDTIQAAVLIEKLKIFPDEIAARNRWRERYADALGDVAIVPRVPEGYTSVWAQYTIRARSRARATALAAALKAAGHPDRDLLSQAAAPPDGLSHFPGRRRRAAGHRAARRGGHQPADARLSRRADPGPHHRGGAAGAEPVSRSAATCLSSCPRLSGHPRLRLAAKTTWIGRDKLRGQ